MVQRMKRWLGFGATPAVGIEFRDDGAYVALVRSPAVVVGLGRIPLPVGTVVDGCVKGLDEAARAVAAALSSIHWRREPSIRVAVPPEPWSGVNQPGIATGTVTTGGRSVGAVAVAEPVVLSAVAAVRSMPGVLGGVEPSPVSVARFLRVAHPGQPLRFARLTEPERRWTLCDAIGSFEVEIRRQPGRTETLVAGVDQARMGSISWGSISVEPTVRTPAPRPEFFTSAVGAALSEFVPELTADLAVDGSVDGRPNRVVSR